VIEVVVVVGHPRRLLLLLRWGSGDCDGCGGVGVVGVCC
jgi:hypothetical protein